MELRWGSFPYRPDSTGEFESDAITPPEELCQAERHMFTDIPAAWLELLFSPDNGGMLIRRAWFTCSGCHAALEADKEAGLWAG